MISGHDRQLFGPSGVARAFHPGGPHARQPKPPVKAASLPGWRTSGTVSERGPDDGAGRVVCLEPDGGDVRHEAIWARAEALQR
jgi:hypothetical protein